MKNPIPTFDALVKLFDKKHPNLAYIHVLEPDSYGVSLVAPDVVRSNKFIDDVRLPRPVIHANGYDRISALKETEAEGVLIGFGRSFISNPDLPKRLESNSDLAEADFKTFFFGDHKGYTDYPFSKDIAISA
jgi:NADPH2 dehydrogenase